MADDLLAGDGPPLGPWRGDGACVPADLLPLRRGVALVWQGDWDGAHAVVQGHEGVAAFDWLHGVLHRIEADAGNARYWLARAGAHGAHARLAALVPAALASRVLRGGAWWPQGMVAACHDPGADGAALRVLQGHELRIIASLA